MRSSGPGQPGSGYREPRKGRDSRAQAGQQEAPAPAQVKVGAAAPQAGAWPGVQQPWVRPAQLFQLPGGHRGAAAVSAPECAVVPRRPGHLLPVLARVTHSGLAQTFVRARVSCHRPCRSQTAGSAGEGLPGQLLRSGPGGAFDSAGRARNTPSWTPRPRDRRWRPPGTVPSNSGSPKRRPPRGCPPGHRKTDLQSACYCPQSGPSGPPAQGTGRLCRTGLLRRAQMDTRLLRTGAGPQAAGGGQHTPEVGQRYGGQGAGRGGPTSPWAFLQAAGEGSGGASRLSPRGASSSSQCRPKWISIPTGHM